MTWRDCTKEHYTKFDWYNPIDLRRDGLLEQTDPELFEHMIHMILSDYSKEPLRSVARRMIAKFQDRSPDRVKNYNTIADAFVDPVLTEAVLKHPDQTRWTKIVQKNAIEMLLKAGIGMENLKKPTSLLNRPQYSFPLDLKNGLKVLINDTWAYDVDILEYKFIDQSTSNIKLRMLNYDHFGLDESDVDKKFGFITGIRAWFILQHIIGYIPFWTVVESTTEIRVSHAP